MKVVRARPTSPGRRHRVGLSRRGLHRGSPHAPLVVNKPRCAGRNNEGRITVRHKGGGHKQKYRLIDFRRNKRQVPAIVERIEYDPNRSAYIALLKYIDGERRYIIAPRGLKIGARVISGAQEVPIETGNALLLRDIPIGTILHCIEMRPGRGAQLARSAGSGVQLVAREDNMATLRLPSGEMRKVSVVCQATIGEVGNHEYGLQKLGKAGAKRWRGVRPTVRGVAMNPVDHPHGGGEGKTSGGRHPVSPWGKPTKGYKTRKKRKASDQWIVRKRK